MQKRPNNWYQKYCTNEKPAVTKKCCFQKKPENNNYHYTLNPVYFQIRITYHSRKYKRYIKRLQL